MPSAQNPFQKCKGLWKKCPAETEVLTEREKLLRWKDSSVKTMAANAVQSYSEGQVSRWSKEKKPLPKYHSLSVSWHITKTWVAWTCMIFMCQDTDLQSGQRSGGSQSWPGPFTVPWWIAGCSSEMLLAVIMTSWPFRGFCLWISSRDMENNHLGKAEDLQSGFHRIPQEEMENITGL